MLSYEAGVLIAFMLWAYNAVMIIVNANSLLERNLNRIGQRLSWLTLTPKPMDSKDLERSALWKVFRYLLITGFGLPFVLLSWGYVMFAVATILYRRAKDSGAPQVVREFRWKMRNSELSFDHLVREIMKVSEEQPVKFDEARANLIRELEERGLRHS